MRLYYASPNPVTGLWAIGAAASADGLAWKKRGLVLAGGAGWAQGVSSPNVHRLGPSSWIMFFEARAADGLRSIGVATSSDGWAWRVAEGAAPVLAAASSQGAWDQGGVGAPCALQEARGGRWRLYYEGYATRDSLPCGVGLATADGPLATTFDRMV